MMDYDIPLKVGEHISIYRTSTISIWLCKHSYTDFTYLAISLSKKTISADEQVTVTVKAD